MKSSLNPAQPKVSVLIPTYNRAGLLTVAVQSVLDQTYRDFEIIIIDDGSTDETRQVVATFTDERIRYIFQENQGISGAVNRGVSEARGDYIARVDSDDRWLPTLLEEEVAVLEASPDIGLVYSVAQAMDDQGKPLAATLGAPERFPGQSLKSIIYGDFLCTITNLIRRECLAAAGPFDPEMSGTEDWDMWVRLARICQFYFIDKTLAHFRVHAGRTTGKKSTQFERITQSRIKVLDKVFNQPDLPAQVWAIKNIAYRNTYMDMALRWLGAGEYRKTWRYLKKAMIASGNWLATLARFSYLIVLYRFLSKHSWGIRLVNRVVRFRRKLRV